MNTMTTALADIRAVLATTPARWQSIAALPTELLARPPLAGQWSALGCLRHLVTTETTLYPVRIGQFRAGEPFGPFDADIAAAQADDAAAADLLAQFLAARTANLTLIDSLTPDDLVLTTTHPALGHVTLLEMLHAWAAHDLNHTMQAERSVVQPIIAGCGPWRNFFKDLVM
jgi:hypothetical protein